MQFSYTFDGGAKKTVESNSSLYNLAAVAAFAQEPVERLPVIGGVGVHDYSGHVLKIWSEPLIPEYGPYGYGIGVNECGSITIVTLLFNDEK